MPNSLAASAAESAVDRRRRRHENDRLSDFRRRAATGLAARHDQARPNSRPTRTLLIAEIHKYEVAALVIGLPLALDGSDTPRAQAARAFSRNFVALEPMPVTLWDERFSTAAVERDLIALDVSRARRAEVIDKMAAAYILQGALDAMRAAKFESDASN